MESQLIEIKETKINDTNCPCIVNFFMSIELISDTKFSVKDNSIYSGPLNGVSGSNNIKMSGKENSFEFDLPVNGFKVFDSEEQGLFCLSDWVYCLEVTSCGKGKSINVPVVYHLRKLIRNKMILGSDDSYYSGLLEELDELEIGLNFDTIEEFKKVYESIEKRISCN